MPTRKQGNYSVAGRDPGKITRPVSVKRPENEIRTDERNYKIHEHTS